MVLIIFLRFIVRGVLRKTAGFLDAGFCYTTHSGKRSAIITRAANAAESEYDQLKQKIRDGSNYSMRMDRYFPYSGKGSGGIWYFAPMTTCFLSSGTSRGNNVLEEILGKAYSGILVCDCWRAYDFLSKRSIRRCWAHLLPQVPKNYAKAFRVGTSTRSSLVWRGSNN